PTFNAIVEELERRGREDLLRQGVAEERIQHRLELDMRYGNQLAQTAVVAPKNRITAPEELMALIEGFSRDYGRRYGEGSQAPEAGIRINTVRVASYSQMPTLELKDVLATSTDVRDGAQPFLRKDCHFVGHDAAQTTAFYELGDLGFGTRIAGPAVVLSPATTFLVEPGWTVTIGRYGSGLFERK
ncbi:MAG: hydantoinase/oxoprolinase family protein, partial [Gammaproteobacteria bacterium]